MAGRLRIVEVSPRDGLQNEAVPVSPATRIALIEALIAAGLTAIEAGSFVSARAVPQMAGTEMVLEAFRHRTDISLPVLVPNEQGFDAALAAGARQVAVFTAASESFCQKNINCSIAQSFNRFEPVMRKAKAHGIAVRGYVSCVLGCPYEGAITPEKAATVAARLFGMGCYEISLGDTIGAGIPQTAERMFLKVAEAVPASCLALHFHDTGGMAIANIKACLPYGARTVDAAVGGLGGCPFAKGAPGNVATGAVLDMASELNYETGIDRLALGRAMAIIGPALGRDKRFSDATA